MGEVNKVFMENKEIDKFTPQIFEIAKENEDFPLKASQTQEDDMDELKQKMHDLENQCQKLSKERDEAMAKGDHTDQDLGVKLTSADSEITRLRSEKKKLEQEVDRLKNRSIWQVIRDKLPCCRRQH
ncbi:uncharacterized protein LOC120342907 isoform X2 [Styela clava]|uniref:uncharacterized protein LOC120342907 n=1 Tax=Styela clava TaxID=7725 RepID=UPI001939495E|nr:uncharacterized protein LOC120342907 [Styela clava]